MRTGPWLLERAALAPESVALERDGECLSFVSLAERALHLAGELARRGVRSRETVGVLVDDGFCFSIGMHAVLLLGARLLPLHPRLTPGELAPQLLRTHARVLLHGNEPLRARAQHVAESVPGLECLEVGRAGARRKVHRIDPVPVELAEEAVVIFTSGTTGAPRGACLTYGNFLWSAWASSMHLGGRAGERWLACLPWCHVGGLSILMRSVLCGGSVLVHDRFDPEALNASLDADGVTGVSLVPTMLKRLLDARGKRTAPAPLGAVLLGGAAASGELVERAWKLGFPVLPTYGLTEACSQVATLARGESGRAGWVPGSVGRPLFGIEVRIADAEGRTKPAEEAGEIWIRGPTVMKRYLDDPEANACTLRDGWLRSGDVGVLGGHGELRVLDRRSDLVVSGGENVYPAEVESVLLDHPDVEEVGVAAVTDADLGQRVEAWVVVRSGRARDPAALRAFCRTRLAGYKVPRTVHVVTALPRNSLGKLLRRKLPGS